MMERELDVAIEAVRKACRLCVNVRRALVTRETIDKNDKSPVTVADFGAQAVVNLELAAAFRSVPIVAEEDAAALRADEGGELKQRVVGLVRDIVPGVADEGILDAIDRGRHSGGRPGRFWALDPIDGTKGFIRADQYAVALALIEDGDVVLGVLGCPNLEKTRLGGSGVRGVICAAVKGQGAFAVGMDDDSRQRLTVSTEADPSLAVFCESVESGHTQHDASADVTRRLGVRAAPLRLDSQCKYAVVARGEASVYLRLPTRADYQEKIWDHAAGALIVSEAGGCVSDTAGRRLDFSLGRTLKGNQGVVATNGRLHDAVLASLRGA